MPKQNTKHAVLRSFAVVFGVLIIALSGIATFANAQHGWNIRATAACIFLFLFGVMLIAVGVTGKGPDSDTFIDGPY